MRGVDTVDIAWLLVCAVLVLLMQAGFTALESGLVRSKNSVNVAIKNFANFLVAASLFWLFGFGLMFGSDHGGLLGGTSFLFDSDSSFLTAFFVFQLGFIGTATTLMSGAVAERMRFAGYLVLATLVAALVYPVFGHWAWGEGSLAGGGGADGWLRGLGFVDFAGSTVVHSTGGWAALAAIIVLGPRIGRFGVGAVPIHGHDLPVTTVGVFVLWVGWYGFNGGSTLALTSDVPAVIQNTTLAATFGGLVGMALTWRRDRRPDVVVIMNGSLAGLVAVTASANIVSPIEAAIVGGLGAVVMQVATIALERVRIDDAVGAVPVHLAAGIWGTLAVALFGNLDAFPDASNRIEQLGIQLLGVGVCFLWAFGLALIALTLINRRFPLRIDPEGELAGLNIAEHGRAPRSRTSFRTSTSNSEAATSLARFGSNLTRRSASSPPSTTGFWRRSGTEPTRSSSSAARQPPPTSPRRSMRHWRWLSARSAHSPTGRSGTRSSSAARIPTSWNPPESGT